MRKITAKLVTLSTAMTLTTLLPTHVFASDFNVPFINASELGNMYSGWATSANDASTEYTNPAGLVLLKHQQLVVGAVGVMGSTQFSGTTMTPPYPFPPFGQTLTGDASSKLRGLLPFFYYALPINNKVAVGFGQNVPFALGTNYNKDSVVRYAATRTQIVAVDVGPSVGIKMSEQFSIGIGLDAERLAFTMNNMYGPPVSMPTDSEVQNNLSGWGYGWHGGVLYQPLSTTRIGLSFNSQVMFHTTGSSQVFTPSSGTFRTTNQKTNAALPARAQLSLSQDLNDRFTVMATLFYTNWSELQQLTLKRVMTPDGSTTSVTIPFGYHNTMDYSIGLNFKATEKWLLKTGVNILNAPSNNRNRSMADPIGAATIIGIGAHYQQNPCIGYDVGYAHSFFKDTTINVATPLTTASGTSTQNANIFGAQLTWNIA